MLRGDVPAGSAEAAVAKLRAACEDPPAPVLSARVALTMSPDPALERPAVAKASVDVSGRVVRAHVACPTMTEAIDLIADRIRRGMRRLHEAHRASARRPAIAEPGEWRHGDLPTRRPPYFPRPVGDRRLVRTKSVSIGRLTPEEAAFEMRLLDHDFHLYSDARTGSGCVLHRTPDGLALIGADPDVGRGPAGESPELPVRGAPRMALPDALAALDASEAPFVAFVDASRDSLHVAYRRYDGHYGVIGPADGP